MKRYPVYKDSGVEGLGEIPEHWEVKRLASLGKFSKGSTISKSDLAENGLPVILYGDIYTKYNLRAETIFHFITQDLAANSKQIYKGDLLFTGSGETREDIGKCIVYNGNSEVYAGGDILIFRQKTNDSLFLAYFFSSNYAINKKAMNSRGDIVVHIYASSLRDIYIPIPPLSEQKVIAHFLDYKIEQIEQYIRNKQRLIELLNEQKAAIINRAVTKGINPNAPMKHSGINLLAEIPKHWGFKRLKYLVPGITVGIVVTPAKYYVEFGIPCLRSLNISSGQIDNSDLVFISEYSNEIHRKSKIFAGDIVVVRTGQTGTAAIVTEEYDGANCIDLLIIRQSQKLLTRYLYFYLNSYATNRQVSSNSVGAIQSHYNTGTLSELWVTYPPQEEQEEIVNFINDESRKIDQAIAQVEKEIELIQEYRTTLISDAVTGKIDVRGFENGSDSGNSPKPPELATM